MTEMKQYVGRAISQSTRGRFFNVLYSFITFLWTMTHSLLYTDLSLSLPLRAIRHPSQTVVEGLMLQNEYIKCIFISSGKDQMCNCAWSHVFNNGAVNREPASSGFRTRTPGSKINSHKCQMWVKIGFCVLLANWPVTDSLTLTVVSHVSDRKLHLCLLWGRFSFIISSRMFKRWGDAVAQW